MTKRYTSDIAFTPAVKAVQARKGSRKAYARMEEKGGWRQTVSDDLARFIAARDSLYLATADADGQPYIQHRGGPEGFLKVLDDRTLAFADFTGNRQYITVGNLSENDKAAIFLMDYGNRRRIKIWGRARVVEDDPGILERLLDPVHQTVPEHAIVFTVEAWDANCPKHITPRFTEDEVAEVVRPLQARIAELEAELAAERSRHNRRAGASGSSP